MSWIPPTRAAGRPPPCVPAEPESATRALPILSLHAVVLLTTVYFHIYLACVPYKGTTCRSTLRQPSDTIKNTSLTPCSTQYIMVKIAAPSTRKKVSQIAPRRSRWTHDVAGWETYIFHWRAGRVSLHCEHFEYVVQS